MSIRPDDSSSPATECLAVTPTDGALLPRHRGVWPVLYIGVAGNVALVTDHAAGGLQTLSLPAGIWPVRVRRVDSTGTTASNIIAIW